MVCGCKKGFHFRTAFNFFEEMKVVWNYTFTTDMQSGGFKKGCRSTMSFCSVGQPGVRRRMGTAAVTVFCISDLSFGRNDR